jgi:SAM-dependent methyltransferase
LIGDAIGHLLTTPSGAIWVGYFDEGIYGTTPATHGLVRFAPDLTIDWAYPQTALAVEPSSIMIAQRPAGAAPALQAAAESIPLGDAAADAVMALLTVHHWTDLEAGIAEIRRIARRRVVVLTWDQSVTREFWLLREYRAFRCSPRSVRRRSRRACPG